MKLFLVLAATLSFAAITLSGNVSSLAALSSKVQPKEVTLGKDAKATGQGSKSVLFTHETHSIKPYSADGKSVIGCAECHHTDQPAASAAKTPPLKTAHPADRTTALTADLLAKDPKAPDVLSCRACHAQEGVKPKVGAAIPEVVYEGDTDPTVLNNEEAYHRNCNVCHDLAVEKRKDLKIPTSQACKECHTGKK